MALWKAVLSRFPGCCAVAALLCGLAGPLAARVSEPDAGEVRALWVLRNSLTSPEAIGDMVGRARAGGFTTLLVQVRARGDACFNGGPEPRAPALAAVPVAFDPLSEVIKAGHAAGLSVHAWVSVNLVASASELPSSRAHVIYRHPEWLMVPRALAQQLADVDPRSPAFVGKLARWTRAEPAVEGLYLSPVHPGAVAYTTEVVDDLVTRYPLDGVHLDYLRFPDADFDYGATALAEFRANLASALPPAERERLEAAHATDRFAYVDTFPERWSAFRRSRLTALAMRLRTTVKARRPRAVLSVAVVPDEVDAFERRLQDWRTWLDNDIVDVVCPMAYTPDLAVFAGQIATARAAAGPRRLWAGIGAYRLPPERTIEHILAARQLEVGGVVLFSYDSLTNPAQQAADSLMRIARAAFGGAAALGLR